MIEKICPKCEKPHNKPGIFCSRSCANSKGPMSESDKELRRNWALSNPKGFAVKDYRKTHKEQYECRKVSRIQTTCKVCKKLFTHSISVERVYCSNQCRIKTSGGLRKGSGRGKSGYYQGFHLDSTYELAYLIYCLDHNITIQRNTRYWIYEWDGSIHRFYPDFVVNGKLVEIKGYRSDITNTKVSCVDEPISLFYKEDLAYVFEYVSSKTNLKIKDLWKLYE